jgi:hypothetical protein
MAVKEVMDLANPFLEVVSVESGEDSSEDPTSLYSGVDFAPSSSLTWRGGEYCFEGTKPGLL